MANGKKIIAITASIATLGVGAFGASAVFAKGLPNRPGQMAGLVNAIATRFHLNPTEVQSVFDEQRQQNELARWDAMQTQLTSRVTAAVKSGQLTQAQADAITAKIPEVRTFIQSLSGMNPTDREKAIKNEISTLTQWAKDQNIPTSFFAGLPFPGRGMEFRAAPGMMMDPKERMDQAVAAGKLTQAQEDLILAKQTEIKAFMQSLQSMSQADRQAAVQKEMTDVKTWAQTNNIPQPFVPFLGGMHRGGGMMGFHRW